jgi:hypothetical protein
MNEKLFKPTLNNSENQIAKDAQEHDTIIIMIRNGEVICCTQNNICAQCACGNRA